MKTYAIAFLLLFTSITTVFGHEEKGPHGGVMKDAGNYHIELLVRDGKMTVYLLDEKANAISTSGITGTAILQFADQTSATVQLTSTKEAFEVKNEKSSQYTVAIISFKINGKSISAKFNNKSDSAKTYSCPMHPEITADKSGKCSKCGMALKEVATEKSKGKSEEHKGHNHHH
jgi:hypothetical protein